MRNSSGIKIDQWLSSFNEQTLATELNQLKDILRKNTDQQTTSSLKIAILVHGTFASKLEYASALAEGAVSWWQLNGELEKKLGEAGVSSVAFQWSGHNRESHRRAAGERLWRLMCCLESFGIPYSIVSHSHGGNVVAHAIRYGIDRSRPRLKDWLSDQDLAERDREKEAIQNSLPSFSRWVACGTPFFSHKPSKLFVIFRWGVRLLALLGILWVVILFSSWFQSDSQLAWKESLFLFSIFIGLPTILILELLEPLDRFARCKQSACEILNRDQKRVCLISSSRDEAVNALSGILIANLRILPRIEGITIDWLIGSEEIPENPWAKYDHPDKFGMSIGRFLSGMFSFSRRLLSGPLNLLIWIFIEPFVVSLTRATAFGDDYSGLECATVSKAPFGITDDRNDRDFQDSELLEYVSKNDSGLAKFGQELVFMFGQNHATLSADFDVFSEFLIHNAYFRHPKTLELILVRTIESFKGKSSDCDR